MKKQEKKQKIILNIIQQHIEDNLKQYFIISSLFIIGLVIGVMIVNNAQLQTKEQIGTTINSFIDKTKDENYQIDYIELMKNVLTNHILFAVLLWFLGCSLIGIPIVYVLIGYRGFSLGYTIASIILVLGTGKGIIFSLSALLLQNLFIIPAIIVIAVSGTKLYSSIMKNKKIENLKIEIIRHTIFCILMLVVLAVAAIVEVYVSSFLLELVIK